MLKLERVTVESYKDPEKPTAKNKMGLFWYWGERIHTLFMI